MKLIRSYPIRRIPKAILGALLVGLLSAGCIMKPDTADWLDAYTEIEGAIEFKKNECGMMPAYPLILPPSPQSYGLRLCSLIIIRMDCPFNDYPVFCLEMYGVDIPGIGPKR